MAVFPNSSESSTPAPATASATGAAGIADTGGAKAAMTVPTPEVALSDAQIAQIADTANSGEVEQGRYATLHATNARVKQFAQHMVSAHASIGQKMTATLHKEGITPAASSQSNALSADAQQTLSSLKSATGSDFDKSYIDAQVKAHQAVLDTFDNKLIPNAQDAALKANLQLVRPMVAEHLKEAQDIQKSLAQ
jgi:putative membrane protein